VNKQPHRREAGVTLIELMVTLTVLIVLLTVGVSNLTTMVVRNKRTSEVNTMVGHLSFARAEAVLRATDITVCPVDADDPGTCSSSDWADGYAVVDEDAGEALRYQTPADSIAITYGARTKVTFDDAGSANGTNGTFTFCDATDNAADDASRRDGVIPPVQLVISRTGRVLLSEGNDIACGTSQ